MTNDFDAPRGTLMLEAESLEELQTRRLATVETDDDAPIELGLQLLDVPEDELSMTVVPQQRNEFRCTRCFLVRHRNQLAAGSMGAEICRECC